MKTIYYWLWMENETTTKFPSYLISCVLSPQFAEWNLLPSPYIGVDFQMQAILLF